MNAPAEDIKDILEQSSVGLSYGVYAFKEPESPDACITVLDGPGADPVPNYTYEYPSVQVRVRGNKGDYRGAYAQMRLVVGALHGLAGETWNGTKYVQILQQGDIIPLEYDDSNRPVLVANFAIHRTTT